MTSNAQSVVEIVVLEIDDDCIVIEPGLVINLDIEHRKLSSAVVSTVGCIDSCRMRD
jgi:hypothetical protein